MTRWRLALALVLLGVLGVPLLAPWLTLARFPQGWAALGEADRLLALTANSLLLLGGVVALALPLGTVLAVLLERTDLPGREGLRFLLLWTLLIPLPLFATGWEPPLNLVAARPGLPRAVWIHAVAGLPWVVLIVGQGLRWVERELEEDALLAAPAPRVILSVTLPRAGAAVLAAAVWLAVQGLGEITVTDRMEVRTFAEEVYLQMAREEANIPVHEVDVLVARAVAVSAPSLVVMGLAVAWALTNWDRHLPPLQTRSPLHVFRLGGWRWPLATLTGALTGLLVAIPVGSLVYRAGVTGEPPEWTLATVVDQVRLILPTSGTALAGSLVVALVVGLLTTLAAWLASWLALESRRFQGFVAVLVVVTWTLPGPLVGLGLKNVILAGIDPMPWWWGDLLYYRASPAPVIWVQVVRLFPFGVALLWPVMRLLPAELRDAARTEGAGPLRELWYVTTPLTARAFACCVAALAALSLGELAGSKLVSTPGSRTYAERLFIQMHYSLGNDLAAQCLLLLLAVLLAALAVRRLGSQGSPPLRGGSW